MAKGYWVTFYRSISDPAALTAYGKLAGPAIVANGGRVLNVSALGQTVGEAQARAYAAIARIHWPEGFCRHDIGWRAVEREKQ